MPADQAAGGGTLTLDPDEVETSSAAATLDPSEVEDAPSQGASSSAPAQPTPTPQTSGGGSRYEANISNPAPRPSINPLQPLLAAIWTVLPGIPQPQVDMKIPDAAGPFASPKGLPQLTAGLTTTGRMLFLELRRARKRWVVASTLGALPTFSAASMRAWDHRSFLLVLRPLLLQRVSPDPLRDLRPRPMS